MTVGGERSIRGREGEDRILAEGPARIAELSAAWARTLRAENKSPRTITAYGDSVRYLYDYLGVRGMPLAVAHIRREHVEAFILDVLETRSASTAQTYFRHLRIFFKWAIAEGEVRESPMKHMRPPSVEERVPNVVTRAQIRALLAACTGTNGLRDRAIILLFLDTGMRRGELVGLRVQDIDLDHCSALVMGKGRRERVCAFGEITAAALRSYIGERIDGPLWLGERGALTAHSIPVMLRRRCEQAGIERINAHRFRHTFASAWLTAGGTEGDLMTLAGWRSRAMIDRYGRSAAAERARQAHARIDPLNGLLG